MCEHGFIGPCAECDGAGQFPEVELEERTMRVVTSGRVGTRGRLVRMSAVVESKDKPDPEEVAAKAGYHPAGYGCYDATVTREPDLIDGWVVCWSRGASCD